MMRDIVFLVMFCLVRWPSSAIAKSRRPRLENCNPPAISKQSKRTQYIQDKNDAVLTCRAKGDKPLLYVWTKNGIELDFSESESVKHIAMHDGNLVFKNSQEYDAGKYQCRVSNECGTSLSIITSLKRAYMDPFRQQDEPIQLNAVLGKPLKLSCDPPLSVPKAQIYWILAAAEKEESSMDYQQDEETDMFSSVVLGRRVTMDYDGNLYIISVAQEDTQGEKRYICMASNNKVRSLMQGDDKVIKVFGDFPTNQPTILQWHSQKHVLVLKGRTTKFKCIFSGNPIPEVTWRRIDGGLIDEERMQQSTDKHEFIIIDVRLGDAGEYECSASNAMSRYVSKQTITLTVEARPHWLKRPRDHVVGVEDGALIECIADGIPEPKVDWFINGVPINDTVKPGNRQVWKTGSTLQFSRLSQEDTQVIQCNVSNRHGFLWEDVFLRVEAMKPIIEIEPTEQKVTKHSNVVIPCGVKGRPKPRIVWYKGDQRLHGKRYDVKENGDLFIKAVDSLDSGFYMCIAENRFGQADAEGSLVVREKTQIVSPPSDDEVRYGESSVFTCGAVTDKEEAQRLKFEWLKDGVKIFHDDIKYKIMPGGDLYINNTNSHDTGRYTCNVTNDLDSDVASASLKVIAPPDPPSNVSIVSCGDAVVDIEWSFNNTQSNFSPLLDFILEYNTDHNIDHWYEADRVDASERHTEYTISPWATYKFRVKGRNFLGMGQPSIPTNTSCKSAESRPYRNPSNLRTVEDRTGYLIIEWDPMHTVEHNSDGFYYEVTWQKVGGSKEAELVHDWTISKLEQVVEGIYLPYTVTIKAHNQIGASVSAASVILGHSGEAPPLVVPQNFEVDLDVSITSTSAGFRWDPVITSAEMMNGKFTGYKIRYWKNEMYETTLHEELIIVPVSRHQRLLRWPDGKVRGRISNLPSFSQLHADVMAVNLFFSSNGSNIVNFSTPEGVPSRVEYVRALQRGSSHFMLEWGEPDEPNGHITGYSIGYQKVEGINIEPEVVARDGIPANQHQAQLSGLDPSCLYRVFVSAHTKEGPGQRHYIDVKTADDDDELVEPQIVSVLPGEYGANVTFSMSSAARRGQRTGSVHYLEYRRLGDDDWDRNDKVATDHFWLTVDKLEPSTAYEVRVVSLPNDGDNGLLNFKPSNRLRFNTIGGVRRGDVLSAGWFIGMMVTIAVLLLVLIVVCVVKRNRGKEYNFPTVKNTGQDTARGPSRDKSKSERNGVPPSVSFERDPEKQRLEEEADSLEEYGEVDPCRFNEDGSFIGQYGENKAGEGTDPANIA